MAIKPQVDPFVISGVSKKGDLEASGGGVCSFNGNIQIPANGTPASGSTCQDFVNLFFPSTPPTAQIRFNPNVIYYEVGDTPTQTIEARGLLGSNPPGTLTLLRVLKDGNNWQEQTNPTAGTWYSWNDNLSITTTGEIANYRSYVEDNQGRNNFSGTISIYGTYPWFATTNDITILTQQPLGPYQPTYFEGDFVAETDIEKQKADFESGITITGVEFYNTISGQRERLGGSKANSLTFFDVTQVTHTVQGNTVNYNRYTYNGVKVGARKLRFYTN